MELMDIDQIIKEWLDEWKGSTIGDIDLEEDTKKDKGKGKEQAPKKRKTPQEEQNPMKKMKTKAHKPTLDVHLGSDDYELFAHRVHETLDAPMMTIVTAQTEMKSALDLQIATLNTIVENASQMQFMTQIPSTFGSQQGDSPAQGCSRSIHILPTSIRLSPGIEFEHMRFIEVDLSRIPVESLQMVQEQVNEEIRECEMITYAQNGQVNEKMSFKT